MELISKWYKLMSARHPMLALSRLDTSKYQNVIEKLFLAVDCPDDEDGVDCALEPLAGRTFDIHRRRSATADSSPWRRRI